MTESVRTHADSRRSADSDGDRPDAGPRPRFGGRRPSGSFGRFGRRREPVFADNDPIDYKDIARLRRCLDERGKILPRRRLNHSAGVHRQVTVAIKRARHLALLPFVSGDPRG